MIVKKHSKVYPDAASALEEVVKDGMTFSGDARDDRS